MRRKLPSCTPQGRLASASVRLPTLVGLALVGLAPIGCSADVAIRPIGSVTAALSAEQCEFFQADGKVQICHKTASARKPYTILKVSSEACVNSHSAHDGDYIAINDPTCSGQGCFPEGAPYDGSVECCDDLEPDATGHCAATVNDGCDYASVGQVLSLQGVSLTVPTGAPDLSLCATDEVAPTHAANGATITARSPVFELGPSGTTFNPGLPVSFEVGNEPDLSVFWANDGVNFEELDATRVGNILTVSTNHFSPVVVSGNPCALPKIAGDICGVAPAFPCAAEPRCQAQGAKLKCVVQLKAAGTECNSATGGCDVAETCNGTSTSCPADAIASAGTVCRAAGGACDVAEACDGAGKACPTDAKLTSSCRAAADVCDLAESCDGSSNDCPTDATIAGCEVEVPSSCPVLFDSFNRPDGLLSGQQTETGLATWSLGFAASISGYAATWQTVIVQSSVSTSGYVQMRIAKLPTAINHGIYINFDPAVGGAYVLHSDGTSLYLWSYTPSTSYVKLAQTPHVLAVGDVLKVTVDGTLIKGYVNGVEKLSTPMSAGAFPNGFFVGLYDAGSGDGLIDDFKAACAP